MANLHTAACAVLNAPALAAPRARLLAVVGAFFAARGNAPLALASDVELRLFDVDGSGAGAWEAPARVTAAGFEGGSWDVPTRRTGALRSEATGPGRYSHAAAWDTLQGRDLAEWALRVLAAAE
jgi:hypothetical protein